MNFNETKNWVVPVKIFLFLKIWEKCINNINKISLALVNIWKYMDNVWKYTDGMQKYAMQKYAFCD